MKNVLLLFLVLINQLCRSQTCMQFRIDIFIKPDKMLNNSFVTSLEMQHIYNASMSFFNCGITDIVIDENIVLGSGQEFSDPYESPFLIRIYRKEKGIFRRYFYANFDVFNFIEDPVPNMRLLKPNQEIQIQTMASFFRFLTEPGEYEIAFDYINTIDASKTKSKLYKGMDASCFHCTTCLLDDGYFFQPSSNVIRFTIVKGQ